MNEQTDTVTMAVSSAVEAIWTLPPLARLEAITELRDQLEPAERATVREARDPERSGIRDTWRRMNIPATWEQIGNALGVSRSAAWQRFANTTEQVRGWPSADE